MTGRPKKKIQCQARRKYDGQQCQAKGILTKKGSYICRLHGGKSTGPKTINGKIKSLMKLKQFKDKTYEEIAEYIKKNTRTTTAGPFIDEHL
tara:strand:- start:7429 stop:7704 length:276 start_codon:yes stop_codon:yes gene_type:complete